MNKIKFEIKKKEYELPDVLTIDHYTKIYKIKDLLEDKFYQTKLLSTITGAPNDLLLKTNHSQMNYLVEQLLGLFPNNKFPFFDKFELNGIEYGFIPSWKNMSFGEFVDLDTLMNKKEDEIIENLHIICAIMYRPIVSKKKEHDFIIEDYDVDSMIQRAEMFRKELDVKYVLGGNFFFSKFVKQSLKPSRPSLIWRSKSFMQRMVLTWKMRKIIWMILLKRPSAGSLLSTELQMTTLQNMIKSSKQPSSKPSTSFFTLWKKKNN